MGFKVYEAKADKLAEEFLAFDKPVAKPAGTGKKKAKKKAMNKGGDSASTNSDIWSGYS